MATLISYVFDMNCSSNFRACFCLNTKNTYRWYPESFGGSDPIYSANVSPSLISLPGILPTDQCRNARIDGVFRDGASRSKIMYVYKIIRIIYEKKTIIS